MREQQRFQKRNSERGAIAPILLALMVVLVTFALGMLALSDSTYKNAEDDGRRTEALNLADAGVDHVINRLALNSSWRNTPDEQDVALGNGTYHLQALNTDAQGNVKSFRMQGWIPSRTAPNAMEAEVLIEVGLKSGGGFMGALFGDQGVTLNGNPTLDSYKSSEGTYGSGPKYQNGDAGTNNKAADSLLVNGCVNIQGHLYYPHGGSCGVVLVNGTGAPSGGVAQNPGDTTFKPIPPIPADAVYLKSIFLNGSGNAHYIKTDGTDLGTTLPPGTYVIQKDASGSSIMMNGTVAMQVQGSAQTVLYFEGNATINGNGIVNQGNRPTCLLIYGMPTCGHITYNGTTDYHAGTYAPEASVTVNGTCHYYGSVVGNTITGNGDVVCHYDEDLQDCGGVGNGYQIKSWTQTK